MARPVTLDDVVEYLKNRGRRLSSGVHANLVGYLAYQLDARLQQDDIRRIIGIGEQQGVLVVTRSTSLRIDAITLSEWQEQDQAETDDVPTESEAWEEAIAWRQRAQQLVEQLEALQQAQPTATEVSVVELPAQATKCECAELRADNTRLQGLLRSKDTELGLSREREADAEGRVATLAAKVNANRDHVCKVDLVDFARLGCGCVLLKDSSRCNGSVDPVLMLSEVSVKRRDRAETKKMHQLPPQAVRA